MVSEIEPCVDKLKSVHIVRRGFSLELAVRNYRSIANLVIGKMLTDEDQELYEAPSPLLPQIPRQSYQPLVNLSRAL